MRHEWGSCEFASILIRACVRKLWPNCVPHKNECVRLWESVSTLSYTFTICMCVSVSFICISASQCDKHSGVPIPVGGGAYEYVRSVRIRIAF